MSEIAKTWNIYNFRPKVLQQLKHALQPCISDVQIDWNVDGVEDDNVVKDDAEENVVKESLLFGQCPSGIPPIYDGQRMLVWNNL